MTVKNFPGAESARQRAQITEQKPEPHPAVVALLTEALKRAKAGEVYACMLISEPNGPNWKFEFANVSPADVGRYVSYMESVKFDLLHMVRELELGRRLT